MSDPKSPLQLSFVRSYVDVGALPHVNAEVAFVGRSNVGKSSLINALAQRKNLAKTSKTPGATQLMNGFELAPEHSGRWLMDLPGYGFAKVPKAEQRKWATMLNGYIEERENLVSILLLVDGAVGPTALDLTTVTWLEAQGHSITYVATKADKVRPSKSQPRRRELTAKLDLAPRDVIWVSANQGTGIPDLRAKIRQLLGATR